MEMKYTNVPKISKRQCFTNLQWTMDNYVFIARQLTYRGIILDTIEELHGKGTCTCDN
jgi:hypothetical protein